MLLLWLKKGLNTACLYMLLNKHSLVYFASFPRHFGFYAVPSGLIAFADEIFVYKSGKGSVQFTLTQPVPYNFLEKKVIFRVKENQERKINHALKDKIIHLRAFYIIKYFSFVSASTVNKYCLEDDKAQVFMVSGRFDLLTFPCRM